MSTKGPLFRVELNGLSFEGGMDDVLRTLKSIATVEMNRCRVSYLRPVKMLGWTFYRKVPMNPYSILSNLGGKESR